MKQLVGLFVYLGNPTQKHMYIPNPATHPCPDLPLARELDPELLKTSKLQRFLVFFRPLAAFVAFGAVAALGWWWAAIPLLVLMFISVINATHDVVHNNLGLSPKQTDFWLFTLGAIVLQSGHAFRITHLRHHRVFPDPSDPEGAASSVTAFRALLQGPLYVPRIWLWAFNYAKKHRKQRTWMIAESIVAGLLLVGGLALGVLHWAPAMFVIIMLLGAWLYPLVTVHLPHRHAGEDPLHQSHSFHGKVLTVMLMGLGFHLEHHLYPKVPAHQLKNLSRKLMPLLKDKGAEIHHVI